MKKRLARIASIAFLLVVALFVAASVISERQRRQLNRAVQMQSLLVVIADELQDHVRRKGSYPGKLIELGLHQSESIQALAREPLKLSDFDYTSDGSSFRLKVKNGLFGGRGFAGDAQGQLEPIDLR